MNIYTMPVDTWIDISDKLESDNSVFYPAAAVDRYIEQEYGLRDEIRNGSYYYEVIDEQKFTKYLLTWG